MNMRRGRTALLLFTVAAGVAASCSASKDSTFTPGGTSPGGQGGTGGDAESGGMGGIMLSGPGGSGGGVPCEPTATNDFDADGYSQMDGDCNDCDSNVSPNAIEVPTEDDGTPVDEDCDRTIDEDDVYVPCDEGIALDEMDPMIAVKAVDMCKVSTGEHDWGVMEANWVLPDGSAVPLAYALPFHLGHGVMAEFGHVIRTRQGERMLALSSGTARQPSDPGYQDVADFDKQYESGHPLGFPKEAPSCPGTITGEPHDAAGIEVKLRTPSNAHGIKFSFDFFTYEWPDYVCSQFNDFFVALLEPFPAMQMDGNISYDTMGNPVSVNNAFVEVCGCPGNPPAACIAGGKSFACSLGDLELLGTGFGFDMGDEDHASTSWLTTQAPVEPSSEISLRFATYDSGDGQLDSTTLIDDFRWIAKPGVPVETTPVPQ
jgi:hypothetical protein